jgi:hypothetical protein
MIELLLRCLDGVAEPVPKNVTTKSFGLGGEILISSLSLNFFMATTSPVSLFFAL